MLSLQKPSRETLQKFLNAEANLDFTYDDVGASATVPPVGFVIDHLRIKLGDGNAVFQAAKDAMKRWTQFQLGWVESYPPELPIETGNVVAIIGHAVGLWWTNSCRIVYTVNDSGPIERYGFAYGTLPGHVECGEERFLIEWDHEDDSVWYDINAFSKPNHPFARLGYPLVRILQKRFARNSATAMQKAVSGS